VRGKRRGQSKERDEKKSFSGASPERKRAEFCKLLGRAKKKKKKKLTLERVF